MSLFVGEIPRERIMVSYILNKRMYLKYALRFVRNQEDMARADLLAQDSSDQDVDGFWKAMHKMNNNIVILYMYLPM